MGKWGYCDKSDKNAAELLCNGYQRKQNNLYQMKKAVGAFLWHCSNFDDENCSETR